MVDAKDIPEQEIVDYACDSCRAGYYRPTGEVSIRDKLLFPHECTRCGDKREFFVKYPTIKRK